MEERERDKRKRRYESEKWKIDQNKKKCKCYIGRAEREMGKEVERWVPLISQHWWNSSPIESGGKITFSCQSCQSSATQLAVSSCHGYHPHTGIIMWFPPIEQMHRGVSPACVCFSLTPHWSSTRHFTWLVVKLSYWVKMLPQRASSVCLFTLIYFSLLYEFSQKRKQISMKKGVCVSVRFPPVWCQISLPVAVIDSCQGWCVRVMARTARFDTSLDALIRSEISNVISCCDSVSVMQALYCVCLCVFYVFRAEVDILTFN